MITTAQLLPSASSEPGAGGVDWNALPESVLRAEAQAHWHDLDDGSACFFDPQTASWSFVTIQPKGLGAFASKAAAESWIAEEIAMSRKNGSGRATHYERLLAEGVRDPIVIGSTLDSSSLWDGWHRLAICMVRGEPVTAIYGIPHQLANLSSATSREVAEMLVHAGVLGNDTLLIAMDEIKRQRPDLADQVDHQFAGIAYFYDDAPGRLGEMARAAIRISEGTDTINSILSSRAGNLAGLELTNASGQAAVFLPDASEPGRYRASFFDQRGFFGHVTKDTYPELLKEVFGDGYKSEAPGTFERFSALPGFHQGNAVASLVQAVNAGVMTMQQAVATHAANSTTRNEPMTNSTEQGQPSRAEVQRIAELACQVGADRAKASVAVLIAQREVRSPAQDIAEAVEQALDVGCSMDQLAETIWGAGHSWASVQASYDRPVTEFRKVWMDAGYEMEETDSFQTAAAKVVDGVQFWITNLEGTDVPNPDFMCVVSTYDPESGEYLDVVETVDGINEVEASLPRLAHQALNPEQGDLKSSASMRH